MDQYDTFFSHHSGDKPEVEILALHLQDKGGLNPWLDAWHIPGGVQWDQETQKALSACGSCTVFLSAHGWGEYHRREARLALTRREEHPEFLIVPVLLPGASERDMELFNELQWIDFRAGVDDKDAMIRLTAALKGTPPYPEGRPNLSYLITRDARRWEWSGREDISILYRGNQLQQALAYKALSPLAGKFLDASLALEKQQEASRKRRRYWIIAAACLLVIIPYLWISTSYYLSTSDTSRIVVRHGHPGLKVLPGFDFSAVSTNYSIYDLDDPSVVMDEQLGGFWFQRHNGYSKWGEQLYSQLQDSDAGLAYWRVGDKEEGIARLTSGVSSGDKESIRILGYIAMQDDTAVGPAVDAIIIGLQGDDELHAEALTALAVIRDTHPEASAAKFAEMAVSISGDDEAQAIALAEAVSMLGSATQQAMSELIGILRTSENAQVKLAVARALGDIIPRNPEAFSVILPDIAEAISENQGEISHAFLASLATSAQLNLDSLELTLETVASSLEDEDAATRLAAAQVFGALLMKYPAISSDYYSPMLLSLLSDPSEWVRKAALELLPSLSAVSQKLADAAALAALEDVSDDVRFTAVDALTSPHALVLTSRDTNERVRQKAIYTLAEISLGQPLEGSDVESALFDSLDDTSPAVRLEAAQALLLISDQVEADLTPAFEILVAYLLSDDWRNVDDAERMLPRLAGASPGSAAIITQGLLQYSLQDEDFNSRRILDFIVAVGESQPAAATDVVLVLADLLSEERLGVNVHPYIWKLRHLPSEYLTEAMDALAVRMESSLESKRESAAAAVGWLRVDDEVLASTEADALGLLFSDPSSAVRAQAAISLGMIGRNHPAAIGPYLPELLACLVEEEADVRRACAESLANISESDNAPAAEMVSHLAAALSNTDADVRQHVAYALANTDVQAPAEAEGLLSGLMLSADDAQEQLNYASALGIIAGDNPDTADQVIALVETFVSADDISSAQKAIMVLGDLGEKHPDQVEKIVRVLTPLVSASNFEIRRSTILVLRDIGMSTEMSAEFAQKAIEPGLYHTDEDTQYDALANGLQPILRVQPSSAESALPILLEYWSSEELRDKDSFLVSSNFWAALESVYTILGSDDLNILWPLISSRSGGERSVGREAVLQIIIQKPEVIPDVLAQLKPYKNDSRPYVRQSAAVADEMIQIVLRTEENLLSPERWREILRWLPSVGIDEAKEYSLQQIADLYDGG